MLARHRYVLLMLACALVGAGCSSTLEPAPRANEVSGRGEGATIAAHGVRMTARADAWRGTPRALHEQLTPVLMTIVNEGATPIRIGYNQFRLVSASGRRYSALPPFQIEGDVRTRVGTVYYPPAGFVYAPYLSPYFAGAPIYTGGDAPIYPFAPNLNYWNRYGPLMRTVQLPSADMLQKALPEGVLRPGGRVTGFLYFEGVGPEVERVRLLADFRHAESGGRITRLEIPFVVG